MITYSIIQKSQLESENRIDAECYQPEYLQAERLITKHPNKKIYELSKSVINFGAYSLCNQIVFADSGIPFIVTEDINNNLIDNKNFHYVSKEIHGILRKSHCEKNQVLLTMAGVYLGQAAVYDFDFVSSSNQAIAKITLKEDLVDPYYLSTFLNSKYGQYQIERFKTGTGQPNLNLGLIKILKVPIINYKLQEIIKNIVLLAKKIKQESETLLFEAENLLLEELELKDYQPEEQLSCVLNFSEIREAKRIDAEFFQRKYDDLLQKIKKYGAKRLLELVENLPAKFDPVSEPQKNFRYVELANINSSLGVIDGFSETLGKDAPSRAKRILRKNDVVISSIGGSLNKVALVDKNNDGSLASTGFFQLRSEKILPEVLLVIAKSIILQMQLEKQVAGTILAAVPSETLKNICLPLVPEETQQKIADLVRKSHEARKKSKELLEEAKRKVEEMIELANTTN